ncbi:MAG: HD domain-containing protein, partial [Planctomycetota bacterium]
EITAVEGGDAQAVLLENLERQVDLSDALRGGTLNRGTMDAIETAIHDILRCAQSYGVQVEDIRAVATSAMRECINADAVVEWVLRRTGIEMQVIDAAEEARLYFAALTRLWSEEAVEMPDEPLLMLDIGSGATVTSLIHHGKLVHSVDEHFGTIRVFEQFKGLTDSADFVSTVDRFTHGAVRMILRRLPQATITQLVVTGGELRQLAQILNPDDRSRLPCIEQPSLQEWYDELRFLSRPAQARHIGCDDDLAARLMLAASVLLNLMLETGINTVIVPTMRLRDGLLADQLPGSLGQRHLERSQVLAMAQMLGERFGMEAAYAENTASLATQIFDQTSELHQLSSRDRMLLEFTAMVHDIGAYINVRNRHKHSMYLLHSVDLPGLDQTEVEIVSHVVRYHRRAVPQLNHHEFQALDRSVRIRIMILAAILRLAYGLDVERTQRVRKVRCEVSRGRLLMHLDRRQIALERWSIDSKSHMFLDVFGLQVVLLPRREE